VEREAQKVITGHPSSQHQLQYWLSVIEQIRNKHPAIREYLKRYTSTAVLTTLGEITPPSAGDIPTEQLISLVGLFIVDLPRFLSFPINPPADRGFCDSSFGVITTLSAIAAVGVLAFISPAAAAAAAASSTPSCPCNDTCLILGPK